MTIFMELRCESRGEGRCRHSGTRCWSDDNDGPHTFGSDTKKSAADCFGEIEKQAKDCGWVKRREGWVCPNCLKHEATLVEENTDGK